jgi:hypothetical protein
VTEHDDLRHLLGGYVLGGLSPDDRRRFEDHLEACAECRDELGRYAPLPGLLRQAEAVPAPEPELPPDLLPRLLAEVRRRRAARRRFLLVAAAAAVVAFVAVGALALWPEDGPPPASEGGTVVAFQSVGDWECDAEAELIEKGWGTELVLTASSLPEDGPFSLAVTATDGTEQLAATWGATPAGRASVSGATSIQREDIASVRVLGPDGPLLDARMPR